jgi:hypothetical protein
LGSARARKSEMLECLQQKRRWKEEIGRAAVRLFGAPVRRPCLAVISPLALLIAGPAPAQVLPESFVITAVRDADLSMSGGPRFLVATSETDDRPVQLAARVPSPAMASAAQQHFSALPAAYDVPPRSLERLPPSLSEERAVIASAVATWVQSHAAKFLLAHFQEIWGYPLGDVIFAPVPRQTGTWRGHEVIFGSNTAPFPVMAESGRAVRIDFVIFVNPIDYAADGLLLTSLGGVAFHNSVATLVLTELSVLTGLTHDPARVTHAAVLRDKVLQNSLALFGLDAGMATGTGGSPGFEDGKLLIPQTTDPAFDAVSADIVTRIPSGLDFANLTFREAHAVNPNLNFPMIDGQLAERADHSGKADPNGPWAGLPIAHDQDEYDTGLRILHQLGRHLAPGFIIKLIAATANTDATSDTTLRATAPSVDAPDGRSDAANSMAVRRRLLRGTPQPSTN